MKRSYPTKPKMTEGGPRGPVTPAERARLAELCAQVDDGVGGMRRMGEALMECRYGPAGADGKLVGCQRLYRETHETFESYVLDRWGLTSARAMETIRTGNRIGAWERAVKALPEPLEMIFGGHCPPNRKSITPLRTERQVKALRSVTVSDVPEVVSRLAAQGLDVPLTAKRIETVARAVAAERGPAAKPKSEPAPVADKIAALAAPFVEAQHEIDALRRTLAALAGTPAGLHLRQKDGKLVSNVARPLHELWQAIKWATPDCVCPSCAGKGCETCHDAGWLPAVLSRAGAVP